MSFNHAAIDDLFDKIVSKALTLGVFDTVNQHEPKNAPGNGISASVWNQTTEPVARASGLNATSGVVTMYCRIYNSFLQMPLDEIDPDVMSAASTLMNALSGDFTLGGSVRCIDLLGMYGSPMGAQAGYQEVSGKMYRIMTVTIPVVINDLWTQVA